MHIFSYFSDFFSLSCPIWGGEAKPQEIFFEKDAQWLDKNGRK
jgi:hypothetical protein